MNPTELMSKLSRFGVWEIKYYNKKTELSNIYDVCILIDKNNKILSRGISICSLMDQYVRKTGKNKSLGRAIKALENKVNSFEINPIRFKDDEYVRRSFKSKTKEQDEKVKNKLKGIPTFRKELSNDVIEYSCKISLAYPLLETVKEFKFKSEILPSPTKFEKKILERIKEK